MARAVIKIKDRYFLWSTIVDAPVASSIEKWGDVIEALTGDKGRDFSVEMNKRREMVEETGSSFDGYTMEETIAVNRAGENGERLTAEEIYERYSGECDV